MLTEKNLLRIPNSVRGVVLERLSRSMPRGRETLAYRTTPAYLDKATVPTDRGEAWHIVFFGYYPYATIIKRAIALRAACPNVYLTFVSCCIREDVDILRWFDQAYEVEDYVELYWLVFSMEVHALQVTAPPFWPALVTLAAAERTRIVLDLVDTALFHSNGENQLKAEMEGTLLRQSWSLVHKLPLDGLDRLREAYNVDIPAFQLHSLPWKGAFAPINGGKDTSRPHLVYCGGVMPKAVALRIGYGHHIFDPLILATENTGARLDFYVNQNAREMYWEEHGDYLAMAREMSHFHFNRGVPFHELPKAIAEAHFGLLYDNIAQSRLQGDGFRYNMSSKIFSYLEAGLPLIAYRDFTYIRQWIEEHGIGLVYDVRHPEELARVAAGADYEQLGKNVAAFRKRYELTASNHEDQLRAFCLGSLQEA